MEIYTFQSPLNIFLIIVYASAVLLLAALTFFMIHFFIKQVKAYRQSGEKIPARLTMFFMLFLVVPLAASLLFGNSFVKIFYNMEKENACFLEGDVVLVSCEEHDYRGTFMGYDVVLEVDGKRIVPNNTFPKEVVNYFESDEKLVIQYGEIKNDGIYIWSIKTIEE